MSAVIERSTRYTDTAARTWELPYSGSSSCVGTGGLTVMKDSKRYVMLDLDTALRVKDVQHTGVDYSIDHASWLAYARNGEQPGLHSAEGQEQTASSTQAVSPLFLNDMLMAIRTSFGLTVTQMAEIMQVERVTIYAWMSNNSLDSMREGSRDRLHQMYAIAEEWGRKTPLYGKYLHEQFSAGKTVWSLLKADVLEPIAFEHAYVALTKIQRSTDRKLGHVKTQRATNRAVSAALKGAFQQLES